MLNSEMDSLRENASSNSLVADDSDGVGGDIENSSGSSVIVLVGHTLVDATVGDDVDVISLPVGGHDSGEGDGSLLAEGLGEETSGLLTITVTVRHLYIIIFINI